METYQLVANTSSSLTKTQLGCENDETCKEKCFIEKGEWKNGVCIVFYYLTSFTQRIAQNNEFYEIDTIPKRSLSYSNTGYLYSKKYAPEVYSKMETPPTTVEIRLLHYLDPVISASEYTKGCSDSDDYSDAKCFGDPHLKDKDIQTVGNSAYLLLSAGLILCITLYALFRSSKILSQSSNR